MIDIADNMFDLQVALGIDLDNDGRINIDDGPAAALAANADEWRWNDLGDDPDDSAWDGSHCSTCA